MKLQKALLGLSLVACIGLQAQNDISKNRADSTNEVDNTEYYFENINTGWSMYYEDKAKKKPEEDNSLSAQVAKTATPADKSVIALLSEILKVEKDNLETNKKILAVLQKEYDPQPKKIIGVDGTECNENENANCYSMPAFTKEGKLPVFKNFFENPTIENAAEVVKWNDRHTWEIKKRANLQEQALTQFGDEVRPYNGTKRLDYQDSTGRFKAEAKKMKWDGMMDAVKKNNISILYFMSDNVAQNTFLASDITRLQKDYPDNTKNITLVFPNEETKKHFNGMFDLLKNRDSFKDGIKIDMKVSSLKNSEKFGVRTLPSVVALNNKDNSVQTISVGPSTLERIKERLYAYLETKDMINGTVNSFEKVDRSKLNIDMTRAKYGLSNKESEVLFEEGNK